MKCTKCKWYNKPTNAITTTSTGITLSFPAYGHCTKANYWFVMSEIVNECAAFEKQGKQKTSKQASNENLYKDCIIHNK